MYIILLLHTVQRFGKNFFDVFDVVGTKVFETFMSIRVEPDTRLKRVSGTDKALLPSTSIIRVIRVNICAWIE